MRGYLKNPVSKYAIITCLSIFLLLGQVFKQHLHIQHDGAPSPTSSFHDTTYNIHHQDDSQNNNHSAEIDVSFDSFVKKVELHHLFVFLLAVVGILYIPRFLCFRGWCSFKIKLALLYNLFQPPLRAPPVGTYF